MPTRLIVAGLNQFRNLDSFMLSFYYLSFILLTFSCKVQAGYWVKVIYKGEQFLVKVTKIATNAARVQCLEKPL